MKNKLRNRKVIIGSSALVCLVAIVAVCSFFPFVIDPSRWQTAEFLSDELIVVAIVASAFVCVMYIAQAANAGDPNSNIAKAKVRFGETRAMVTDVHAFSQWVRRVLQKRDLEEMRKRTLRAVGIEDMGITDLSRDEAISLAKAPLKDATGKYWRRITDEQLRAVLRVMDGKVRANFVDPAYYLSHDAIDSQLTVSEISGTEGKRKASIMTFNIVTKLIMTVIPAMIFASLVYDSASGGEAATAWMKFASRMMSMASASFTGYLTGSKTNDVDARYISIRSDVHLEYANDKSFVPEDEQAEARREYEEANK